MQKSRTVREGYLGIFSLLGLILFGVLAFWLSGGEFGTKTYTLAVRFLNASGIKEGAPVNYRGVLVGTVSSVVPRTNQVVVKLRLNDKAKIPVGSKIEVSRYGLLGESSIEITPISMESEQLSKISPSDTSCNPKIILCNNDQVEGGSGTQVFANLARLSQAFTNPAFLEKISTTLKNVELLSADLSKASKGLDKRLDTITGETTAAAHSINQTAQDTAKVAKTMNIILSENHSDIDETIKGSRKLLSSLNEVIAQNKSNITLGISNVQKASQDIDNLALQMQSTLKQADKFLRSPEAANILANLDKVSTNAVQISHNLDGISKSLNDPKIILTVQQTLESARSTFENTQKITSDLDELTGDPKFRANLRRLINGLSSLVSTTDQLERQVRLSQALETTRFSIDSSNIPPYRSETDQIKADQKKEELHL